MPSLTSSGFCSPIVMFPEILLSLDCFGFKVTFWGPLDPPNPPPNPPPPGRPPPPPPVRPAPPVEAVEAPAGSAVVGGVVVPLLLAPEVPDAGGVALAGG